MKPISISVPKKTAAGVSALGLGMLIALTGCGADGQNTTGESQTQVFYQMNMQGTGDVPDR